MSTVLLCIACVIFGVIIDRLLIPRGGEVLINQTQLDKEYMELMLYSVELLEKHGELRFKVVRK